MAKKLANTDERFGEYLARLGEVIGHADRREPLRAYMAGLLLPGDRKSVEPMAAKVDPVLCHKRSDEIRSVRARLAGVPAA
jgi:SRSO17 transposase